MGRQDGKQPVFFLDSEGPRVLIVLREATGPQDGIGLNKVSIPGLGEEMREHGALAVDRRWCDRGLLALTLVVLHRVAGYGSERCGAKRGRVAMSLRTVAMSALSSALTSARSSLVASCS